MNRAATVLKIIFLTGCVIYAGSSSCFAQSCNGKILMNETFGSGKSTRLSSGQTPYQYVTYSCVSDGEYTINNAVDGRCHGAVWHEVTEDHTPNDVDGNMMLVNSSYQSGEFYSQSVSGLCKGATYEFSLWFLNIYNLTFTRGCSPSPVYPSVTISVETEDGILIKSEDSGLISSTNGPAWVRRAMSFTLPLNVGTVKIRLINKNLGGCGNDFALDDIQFAQCSACSSPKVYVPEVFTPNNDGVNDRLALFFSEPALFELRIYDRWGSVVFSSDALGNQWNGTYLEKPCVEGVYAWEITYSVADLNDKFQKLTKRGQILLLR
ncbi:MAG: gliding motility-associated C-terminal domain-containing protein [Cytophagaceae bacterium]|nr:gliding motility-associated C-terminal domain-containing protein [Cytophagaceae bacterium]